MKMKTKNETMVIDSTKLLLNAAGKLSRNDGIVKSGCGYHDKAKYDRKQKHRKNYDE